MRHQDVDYRVIWEKGESNPADYLSRHAMEYSEIPQEWQKEAEEFDHVIWFSQFGPYIASITDEAILHASCHDATLKKVKEAMNKGFISKKDKQ